MPEERCIDLHGDPRTRIPHTHAPLAARAVDARLIQLRDRMGLMSSEAAWAVLQRLTWIWNTDEAVELMNRAIDDVLGDPRRET